MNNKKPTFAFYSTIISILIYSLFISLFLFLNTVIFKEQIHTEKLKKNEKIHKEKINLKQFVEEKKKIEKKEEKLKKEVKKKQIKNEKDNIPVKNENKNIPNNSIDSKPKENIKLNSEIKKSYGEKFYKLSENQQKFIVDNLEIIKKITKDTLEKETFDKIPENITGKERNTIEFYFNSDGSISNLHFLNISNYKILEQITEETIKLSYKKYPKPNQQTLIRFTISYNL